MIEFKLAMRTDDGTRMFRAVMDGQVCIRPEWMFDPFREARLEPRVSLIDMQNEMDSQPIYGRISLRAGLGIGFSWQGKGQSGVRPEPLETSKRIMTMPTERNATRM